MGAGVGLSVGVAVGAGVVVGPGVGVAVGVGVGVGPGVAVRVAADVGVSEAVDIASVPVQAGISKNPTERADSQYPILIVVTFYDASPPIQRV